MNLHIELDANHPAQEWLEKQADRIGARGHFGTHIDCYTSVPAHNEFILPAHILDCRQRMPNAEEAALLPSLKHSALILHTGNMFRNGYGNKAYFDDTDTSIQEETLLALLEKQPQLILIDSYGIGGHGADHQKKDKTCEAHGCYVIENIMIDPKETNNILTLCVRFDLNYPSTGKPCTITY